MEEWAGAKASITMTVMDSDTAIAVGSGDLAVLGTPRLIAMCEAATVEAISALVPEGKTSVGTRVEVEHLQASAVGRQIVIEAKLESVEGRKLVFFVEARQSGALIMAGNVHRVVVDIGKFMDRLDPA
jgi:fluoroacetyl-CoA thioesterase